MSGEGARRNAREDYDASLLRLYGDLGAALTYRAVVEALRPELERMLGYRSVWLQIVDEDRTGLLTLDSGGPVVEIMKRLLADDHFHRTVHGEEFVVVPLGDDPWLAEIMSLGDIHVTEDARAHPLTNKDLVAVTEQVSVVCVPLRLAGATGGWLSMGTLAAEGVLVPDEEGLDYLRRLANHVAVALDRVRFLGEHEAAEDALRETVDELRFRSFLLDSVMDGVIVRDAETAQVLYVNDAMCRLSGMLREQLMALHDFSWASVDDRDRLDKHFDSAKELAFSEIETETADEYRRPVQLRTCSLEYMGRRAVLSVVSDITERKSAQATIEYLALHDPLTGLANRALVTDRLELAVAHARRTAQPLVLMFVDIDNFKVINDTIGHGIGDMLLQEVARRLRVAVRVDDTVGRFGGDEFILLFPGIGSPSEASWIAEKLVTAVREPFVTDPAELVATVSIGVAIHDGGSQSVAELLRNADVAMNTAKESGKDSYCLYDSNMEYRDTERYMLRQDLQRAIDQGELEVHFQPIVRLRDASIVGAEALCRWTHPERGPISPGVFIPLAEECGFICDLGEWVLRKACGQAGLWQRAGHPMRVSVNLSPRQMAESSLVAIVTSALEDAQLPPELLQLEITETSAMRDASYLIGVFHELRALGVRIAIDDFGTGYSSLDYLMRFPVDTLKVDRSFVRDVCEDKGCHAIARAVVSMSQALGLDTVAEGVETEEQRELLLAAECPCGQGFLFSPAMPAERFWALVAAADAAVAS